MAICPFAVWRPVAAHGGPILGVLGVVEHVTAGEGDPYNEFANPANQVSSHFGLGNGQGGMADGLIEQYVDTANQSWAQSAGNGTYLSVETEGVPGDPLTAAQVASFGRIMAWAAQTHGVPLVVTDTPGQRGLIGHGDGGQAWGGHLGCPGPARLAQRPVILAVAGWTPVPSPPPPHGFGKVGKMNCEDPATGGEWIVDLDGHVEGWDGATGFGGINQPGPWGNWKDNGVVWGIRATKDANNRWGYDIIYRHNVPFSPPGGAPGQYFSPFHFARPAGV
jgi:N-acetylmuramoyl-L-alanine amidase